MVRLDSPQIEAVKNLGNGKILCGDVGTGKSRTALAYYFFRVCGGRCPVNGKGKWQEMKRPRNLVVITTAKKRDSKDWEKEALSFNLNVDPKLSESGVRIVVDSWNNIKKYADVYGAFFIFDEQRVTGKGPWVKAFYKITRKNQWILLSATPGDVWTDYVPVFVANGFFRSRTDFERQHCIFNQFITKYRKVEGYYNERVLKQYRDSLLVDIPIVKLTIPHHITLRAEYDKSLYLTVVKDRWDPFDDEPIEESGKLCYLMRKVVNQDRSRTELLKELCSEHDKIIVFYNYTYEVEILRALGEEIDIDYAEWNGIKHQPIPDSDKWLYFVQYLSGAEGWNCIDTDTIVFYSQSYSYRTMIQSEGRIDRRNTPFTDLYYYHFVSNAPIDKAIKLALSRKKDFNENSFMGLKKNRRGTRKVR